MFYEHNKVEQKYDTILSPLTAQVPKRAKYVKKKEKKV
jgi:hypothetical protein